MKELWLRAPYATFLQPLFKMKEIKPRAPSTSFLQLPYPMSIQNEGKLAASSLGKFRNSSLFDL